MVELKRRAYLAVGRGLRSIARLGRRFRRDEKGVNAVEFALVATPFFGLLMAIIEAALAFFAGQVLETALRDTARMVRTGQAHQAGFDAGAFRAEMCRRSSGLLTCGQIIVDLRVFANFGAGTFACRQSGGNVDPGATAFQLGQAGSVMVAIACYQWPTFANILGRSLSNQANGSILLTSTAAFRNEPFQNAVPAR